MADDPQRRDVTDVIVRLEVARVRFAQLQNHLRSIALYGQHYDRSGLADVFTCIEQLEARVNDLMDPESRERRRGERRGCDERRHEGSDRRQPGSNGAAA